MQEGAGQPCGKVFLPQVDPVGLRRQRHVETVIDNEEPAVPAAQLPDGHRLPVERAKVPPLVPELDHRCPAFESLGRDLTVAEARDLLVGDDAEGIGAWWSSGRGVH